jgi:hypothetical protein
MISGKTSIVARAAINDTAVVIRNDDPVNAVISRKIVHLRA